MNLAFGALIIIILLMPGAAFVSAYTTSNHAKNASIYTPFNDLLLKGVIFSVLFHASAICCIYHFSEIPKIGAIYLAIAGKDINFSNEEATKMVLDFCTYILILIGLAFSLGKFLKFTVQRRHLDFKWSYAEQTNYWYRIFSGKMFYANSSQKEKMDFLFLDVMVADGIIYSGILFDYNYSASQNSLEAIVLAYPQKRIFYKRENGGDIEYMSGAPQEIGGDIFLIPAEQILNYNLSYVDIIKLEDQELKK